MRQIDSEIAPKALNDLGHLASGVGHNVINAFSAIVSNAELLRIKLSANATPIDPASIADMIIDTAMEASSVARRLIDFTRPITSIGQETLALDRLIADYVEAGRRDAEEDGILWMAKADPVPPIRGQAGQLESMLDLLVANARESATAGREMAISFSTSIDHRGWVMLEIKDTGRGMEPEILERAVEPFFSTKSGHIGVGLSIANGIWRRHRGTLSLHSQPGKGTTLKLCVEPSSS
jgi:two-component system, NtrC family, sensor kinase